MLLDMLFIAKVCNSCKSNEFMTPSFLSQMLLDTIYSIKEEYEFPAEFKMASVSGPLPWQQDAKSNPCSTGSFDIAIIFTTQTLIKESPFIYDISKSLVRSRAKFFREKKIKSIYLTPTSKFISMVAM